jgi:hypothetical protein
MLMLVQQTTQPQKNNPPLFINQEQTRLVPIADATRSASSHKQSDHEDEDNDYHLDTLLQEATRIDGVNARRNCGGRAVRHQQVQQEMVLSSDEESENGSISSERVRVVDSVQQFQHEMVSSDDESENDSTPSPAQADADADAVQQKIRKQEKKTSTNTVV